MINTGLHKVTEITLQKPQQLPSGGWVRRLNVYIKGNSHPVEITLFGKSADEITIKPAREDEC